MEWQLWKAGSIERQLEGFTPLLASWEKNSHPAQIRLREYLDAVTSQMLPLPDDVPLFLHLDVDVEDSMRLLHHYDLENYLTPLFGSRWLPSSKFHLVTAKKSVGGGSRITWGLAVPADLDDEAWSHFSFDAGQGTSKPQWKQRIRNALSSAGRSPLPPGPVKVRLAWCCADQRNWSSLWKPTGDAMEPVLGCKDPRRPYHLNDDRIVDLELHRNVDNKLGFNVVVGMWWRMTGDS